MDTFELMTLGRRIRTLYERLCQPLCKDEGINQGELDVIMFIANNPQWNTARDLCRIRGLKSGIVSVSVDALMRDGYLTRSLDETDRRLIRLNLTDKSLPLVKRGRAIQSAFYETFTRGISSAELESLMQINSKIIANLKIVGEAD